MTVLMLASPMIGMPDMDLGAMLGNFFRISSGAGWVMHFIIGCLLAVIYAAFFASRLPGSAPVRGALYGVIVFFVAHLEFLPSTHPRNRDPSRQKLIARLRGVTVM